MPMDQFRSYIDVLARPGPDSNSIEKEGRKIVLSDGERGYHIVNLCSYRNLKSLDEKRVYMRDYMRKGA